MPKVSPRESDLPVFLGDDAFDARQFLRFLGRRARFIFAVCVAATLAALIASLLLPEQYTAVASVWIDPPAGGDPRAAVALNPAYIESLSAYETLAASDSLFARAVDQFHLRPNPSASLSRLKRRILRVSKLRDTRVLDISVTLPDPKQAQAVAQFLAGETILLTRSASEASDQDLLQTAQKNLDAAEADLAREQAAWAEFSARQPEESLRSSVDTLVEARAMLQTDLLDARADAAESRPDADAHAARVQARAQSLEQQDAQLAARIEELSRQLAGRDAMADQIRQRVAAAQASFTAAATRLHDLRAQSGMRAERLRLFDPGVAPDRPSSPNVPLNAALAFFAALLCSLAYFAVTFHARPDDR